MKIRHALFSASFLLGIGTSALLGACANTPRERTRQVAVIQKASVDGLGGAYLRYCEVVRVPACMAADEAANAAGAPQTKADRVACLRPCDSASATKIRLAVDAVRTAQTLVYEAIRDDASPEELAASRQQLLSAAQALMSLLQDEGVLDLLDDVLEGP